MIPVGDLELKTKRRTIAVFRDRLRYEHLGDWKDPPASHFAIAEEVTVGGARTNRPDLVLCVIGIAAGVIELKRWTVSAGEGIPPYLPNQERRSIRPFFPTVQLVMAGNASQGLRYRTIGAPEKYWLRWWESGGRHAASRLLRELGHLCMPDRLLELIHDCGVFDAGVENVCPHTYDCDVKPGQSHVKRGEGGTVWHTLGSGKSLKMVWLVRWIRESVREGRVLMITDCTEQLRPGQEAAALPRMRSRSRDDPPEGAAPPRPLSWHPRSGSAGLAGAPGELDRSYLADQDWGAVPDSRSGVLR